MRLRRSCLAVPGSSPKMLEKARSLPSDQVFLDLEDAVAPAMKTDATRQSIVEALREPWQAPTRAVRVNGVATGWCHRDITYIVERAGADLHCIMVPKVEDAAQVHFVDHLIGQIELEAGLEPGRIGLELQIETARGCLNMEQIAAASRRTETIIFGPGDYAANLGIPQLSVGMIEPDYPGDQWHYICARIVNCARAFGLQAIDGPYSAIRDLDGFATVARRSRLLGMDGKWALHPDQIEVLNRIYAPSPEQFALACAILDAYRAATVEDHRGAVMFRGEMIDEASRKMAEGVVAAGRAAGMRVAAEAAT
jgi:citrate lyase subunit beta / citryl-CoA lyase